MFPLDYYDVPRGTTVEVSSHVRLDLPFVRRQGRGKDCSTSSGMLASTRWPIASRRTLVATTEFSCGGMYGPARAFSPPVGAEAAAFFRLIGRPPELSRGE